MYIDFERFEELTVSNIGEDDYKRLAPMADLVIDHWTLDRVGRAYRKGEELPDCVAALYVSIVDALPPVIEAAKPSKGGLVTSFSNGIDSYSFDVSETVEQQLRRSVGWMAELLPVEWVSAAVDFEGGNGYAS